MLIECLGVAGKTPEEIRKTFNIKNDFTPVRLRSEQTHVVRYCNAITINSVCRNITGGGGGSPQGEPVGIRMSCGRL